MIISSILNKISKNKTLIKICDGIMKVVKKNFPKFLCEGFDLFKRDFFERKYSSKLTLKQRFEAFHKGFTTDEYIFYDIENRSNPHVYLSRFQRNVYTGSINPKPKILNNKKHFYEYLNDNNFSQFTPDIFGNIKNGEFDGDRSLLNLIKNEKEIVLKPYIGEGGQGILFCELNKNRIFVNGKVKTPQEFLSTISNLHNYIVTEYCNQADFLNKIYPLSANTVRMLIINPEGKKPFISHGVLRIGTKKTGKLDNRNQGGLFAEIDLETGKLSSAAATLSSGKVIWYKKHPDSNSKIEGFVIPKWNKFKKEFLTLVERFPEFKHVGWDVLFINENDFIIIEGNSRPVPIVWQVHRPLLKNKRLKQFYKKMVFL